MTFLYGFPLQEGTRDWGLLAKYTIHGSLGKQTKKTKSNLLHVGKGDESSPVSTNHHIGQATNINFKPLALVKE